MRKFIFVLFACLFGTFLHAKTIHILVSLCDNKYQGIYPVPKKLGNGQDSKNNLYWGAMYGLKTYFLGQGNYELVYSQKIDDVILERIIFKHKKQDVYVVADAYNGKEMKKTLRDFFTYIANEKNVEIKINDKMFYAGSSADLIMFVGHNGLMDYSLENIYNNVKFPVQKDIKNTKHASVLGCQSQKYFSDSLLNLHAKPYVLTTGNMAPEGYIAYYVVESFINNLTCEDARKKSAKIYSKYQNIKNPANKLFTCEFAK